MKNSFIVILSLLIIGLASAGFSQQKDENNCKDHPMFNRMPGSWIHSCSEKEFDSFAFPVGKGKTETIEGHLWKINYYPQASAAAKPSELQIMRNFEDAIKNLGGTVVWSEKPRSTMKLVKDGKEVWVLLAAEFTGKYFLTIVQKEAMVQDITAKAELLARGLQTDGHMAIQGIYFDTGKSDLKPESAAAVGEIAKLLKADPPLKVFVVGHTDTVGSMESNLALSQSRAQSVLQALIRDHGIDAARLKAHGCGPFAPVATNGTEEGRAKNRRVELVKQ
ncbi:MAG: OmpA family protein [Candidatus Aminicenantes bacterium]|nr:OmpA family protein [Candidatus Aminicenantes bacterium]